MSDAGAELRPVAQRERLFPDGAAVVIGGSGGVGGAICERLAAQGSNVALTYRSNREAALRVSGRLEAAGVEAATAAVDLSDRAQVAEFMAGIANRFGAIHSAIFAVGAKIPMVHVSEIDSGDWERTIDGDLTGFFNFAQEALPHLRQSSGSLVAVSSAGVHRHPPRDILSTVPKAGIEALVRGIAREEGRFGVRANSIAPGTLETGHFHEVEAELTPEFIEAMRRNTALRRLGLAREAADAAVFLASSAASYITGQSLAVDGGYAV